MHITVTIKVALHHNKNSFTSLHITVTIKIALHRCTLQLR